jgi:N-methylhydantoinase A
VEIVDFRLTSAVPRVDAEERWGEDGESLEAARSGTRPVLFVGSGTDDFIQADVYSGALLPVAVAVQGPAVIELGGTSVVVPPDYEAVRDDRGNFVLVLEES